MTIVWGLLFCAAVAIAYYLGFSSRPMDEDAVKADFHRDYLVGINFLLNEETDKAVDVFIKMMEVDSDTVETHLAVGKLFRRRGEVDRAIRIHQNLIARPQLEKFYREQSFYELGQDYLSAGMIDRAERIFLDLVNNDKTQSARALKNLIDIYQQAREWSRAIAMAEQFESVTRQSMQKQIAHYYCELAEIAFQKKIYQDAGDYLNKAEKADTACARATLLQARVLMAQDDYKSALKSLKRIKDQNPGYLAESIELLATCYEKLNQQAEMVEYLKQLVEEYPRVPVVLILADRIREWQGDKVAAGFVADYVRRYPSLRGIALFVNLYISNVEGRAKEDLHILQNLMKKVLSNKPDYRCTSCGFSGRLLHWQCPGCRQWGVMQSIHNLEEGFV